MENVVARIHRDFSFDLLEAIRDANHTAFLQRIKPLFVNDQVFADRVEYYRMKYPNQNFVTEKQIEEICIKYGLTMGSLMMFSASIPIKNRLEISRFQLLPADVTFTDNDLPNRIFRRAMENRAAGSMSMPATGGGGFVEFRTGYIPSNPDKPFEVVPVGEYFTLLRQPDDRTYRVFLEMDIHGSPWFIEFGTGSIDYGDITFTWRQSHGGFMPVFDDVVTPTRESMTRIQTRPPRTVRIINHFAEVTLRLGINHLQRANRLSLSHNVAPMVVADQSMFQRYGDAVERVGHRMKFKRSQIAFNTTLSFVDDPIILQPVPFGYLVVTKWGADANIPEFADTRQN